jgi:hypothetical protein
MSDAQGNLFKLFMSHGCSLLLFLHIIPFIRRQEFEEWLAEGRVTHSDIHFWMGNGVGGVLDTLARHREGRQAWRIGYRAILDYSRSRAAMSSLSFT